MSPKKSAIIEEKIKLMELLAALEKAKEVNQENKQIATKKR